MYWQIAVGAVMGFLALWIMAYAVYLKREDRSTIDYTPRGDRVIVKRLPPPAAKEGDVVIPGSQQRPLNEGIVIAVGPHKDLADLKPGQHICFLDFAGTAVEVDGEEYLSMREQEIHGVRKAN